MPSLFCIKQIRHLLYLVRLLGEGGGGCLLNQRLDSTGLISASGKYLVIHQWNAYM